MATFTPSDRYDAVIIGGGPAGLAAALTFGRVRRRTLLLDTGDGRNRQAAAMHNVVSRDGMSPAEFRRVSREQLAQYDSVEIRDQAAIDAECLPDGDVSLTLEGDGHIRTRRLLLATGLADDLPPIDGLADLWGQSAFVCPYCHAYEVRNQPIAVLGGGPSRARLALMLARYCNDIVLCANGDELDPAMRSLLDGNGVHVVDTPIARFDGHDGALEQIIFADGSRLARQAVFIHPASRQRSDLAAQLGCALLDDGAVEINDVGQTSVPGIFAAGDMARRSTQRMPFVAVITAAASGTIAAGAIDQDLLSMDLGLPSPLTTMATP